MKYQHTNQILNNRSFQPHPMCMYIDFTGKHIDAIYLLFLNKHLSRFVFLKAIK